MLSYGHSKGFSSHQKINLYLDLVSIFCFLPHNLKRTLAHALFSVKPSMDINTRSISIFITYININIIIGIGIVIGIVKQFV